MSEKEGYGARSPPPNGAGVVTTAVNATAAAPMSTERSEAAGGGAASSGASSVLRHPAEPNRDGLFDGSFARGATDPAYALLPWYRRREYFTRGWTDASIWRAAVSISQQSLAGAVDLFVMNLLVLMRLLPVR